MSRWFALLCGGVLAALAGPLGADILVFNNGDRLTGNVTSIDLENIHFDSTQLGNITVPVNKARVTTSAALAAKKKSVLGVSSIASGNATAVSGNSTAVSGNTSSFAHLARPPVVKKNPLDTLLPPNWSARLELGYNRTRATTVNTQANVVGDLGYKQGNNTYGAKLYYYFDATNNTDGSTTRANDRYGINLTYRNDLSPRWFFLNEGTAERDFVANIRLLAQDTPSIGYEAVKSPKFQLNLTFGPTGRYTDAPGQTNQWLLLLTPREDLKWQIEDSLRLEEDAVYYQDPTQGSNSAWKVDLALIQSLNSWLDLALRFRHAYNPIVGFGGEKTEQYISVTAGVVF